MATRRFAGLGLSTARTIRTLTTACGTSRFTSQLEFERKFQPAGMFKTYLKELNDRMNNTDLDHALRHRHAEPLRVHLWPGDRSIHDTYYDLHDKLSTRGVWIRRRREAVQDAPNDVWRYKRFEDGCYSEISSSMPTVRMAERWEAKVRLGGDYIDSEFEEIEGKEKIEKLLARHLPDHRLDALEITADLITHRATWQYDGILRRQMAPYEHSIHMVLDHVTEASARTGGCEKDGAAFERFEHEVGEHEITVRVEGGQSADEHEQKRRDAAERMRFNLNGLTMSYQDAGVFSQAGHVKGKLSKIEAYGPNSETPTDNTILFETGAYFEWKQRSKAGRKD